ncbi:MAG: copper resistance CopC family protein [Psychrobacillus psychrotolerans]
MKKSFILTLFFLFLFSPSALGHSGLSSSIPASGEVVKGELSSITLLFNTTVEKTSTIKVLNEDGVEVPIEEILINQNEMIGKFEKPLEEGEFTVEWKIIGNDGHPIGNTYLFRVELPSRTDSEVSSPQSHEEMNMTPKPTETNQKVVRESKESNNILIIFAIALGLIAVGTAFWLFRKGRSI